MINKTSQASGIKPADMKLNNRMQILEPFKSGESLSVAAIAERVGVSRQTVMKAIQFFADKGLLVETGKADSGTSGGKRAKLYSLCDDQYLFHVLISPDDLYVALFNLRFEILDTHTVAGLRQPGVDEIVNLAQNVCYRMLLRNNIPRQHLKGMCITTSGIVDHRTNLLKFNSLYPNWGSNARLAEKLASGFDDGLLVMIENVGKVCGSAFMHDERIQGKRGLTMFTSWGGICACLIASGQILNGKDSLIGEIGHMMLEPSDTEQCGCGNHGCFERQVCDSRIRKMVREGLAQYGDSRLGQKPLDALTVRDVFEASAAGDALARAVDRRLAEYFALALKNITLLFNPDLVVLQGDYAWADDYFKQAVNEQMKTFLYYNASSPFRMESDRRPIPEVATVGAYTLLIDRLLSDVTIYA